MSTNSIYKRYAAAFPDRRRGWRYLRILLRTRARFGAHRKWFKLLDKAELRPLVQCDPAVFLRLQRCYLSNGLTFRQRQYVLHSQFGLLARHPAHVLNAIYGRDGLSLANFTEGNVEHRLTLRHCPGNAREGELSVIWDSTQGRLGCITFAIVHGKLERRGVVIGGLQGPNDEHTLEQHRLLTKEMHGLRPMPAMVQAAAAVAEAYGAARLLAVTDEHHALHSRKASTRDKKKLSYNALWTELDALPARAGLVELPLELRERAAEDIPVRKRALYRRRYAMLAKLRGEIHANLAWAAALPSPRQLNALEEFKEQKTPVRVFAQKPAFLFD